MVNKKTFANFVLIKLDKENNSIKLRNGFELYMDNSFDPEKHATVTGTIYGLPSKLRYTGKGNDGMPWKTDMEISLGDRVIFYYLSVINALKKENMRYFFEGDDRYIFISYEYIYAVYGEGFVKPINGYCLIEPCEDPAVTAEKERMAKIGMELVTLNKHSNTNVSFGIVRYVSTPIQKYVEEYNSDEGVDVNVGDKVVLRKVADIPLQYELHSKIDGGKKYLRVQRKSILARL